MHITITLLSLAAADHTDPEQKGDCHKMQSLCPTPQDQLPAPGNNRASLNGPNNRPQKGADTESGLIQTHFQPEEASSKPPSAERARAFLKEHQKDKEGISNIKLKQCLGRWRSVYIILFTSFC